MLKRSVRAGLAWCLLACLCLQPAALAATTINPTSAQSAQITATYEQPESYTITIPDNISIDTPFTVTASNVVVPYGKKAQVSVSSDDWKIAHTQDAQWKLGYKLQQNGSDLPLTDNSVILGTYAQLTNEKTDTFTAVLNDGETPRVAGVYQDTLTFTVSIVNDLNP